MPNSNILVRLGVLWACGLASPLPADELTLTGDAHLSGTVQAINEAGVLTLASSLSPEPILLKADTVEKVEFSSPTATPKPPDALVELANGDLLPAAIETLDEQKLTVMSPQAGRLEIPRAALKSLQLGIRQRNVVYSGPRNLDEWNSGGGPVKNWTCDHNSLIANGPANAAKNLTLPQQFILRFTLTWPAKQMPNYQISFADPLKAMGELSDRYYLQFGAAGLEIKREAAKGKRWNSLVQLNRNPNQYPDHQLQVELRVDRKGSRIQLLLNGEPEGEYADPITPVPAGSGITLVCNPPNGSPQEISNIEVVEFDDARSRHRAEDRGDPQADSLISREDDRWSGSLTSIVTTGDTQTFRFKSSFQKDLLEIPAADVSTVFFAATAKQQAEPPHQFVLHLRGEGSLRLSSCLFTDDTVAATHPLLGKLQLRRDGIMTIERTKP